MDQLLHSFSTSSADQWKAQLEKDLKGISFDQLLTVDNNNITIQPFYTLEDRVNHNTKFEHTDWSIISKVIVENENQANLDVLHHLNNGADGIWFILPHMVNLSSLLENIQLEFVQLHFECSHQSDYSTLKSKMDDFLKVNNHQNLISNILFHDDAITELLLNKNTNNKIAFDFNKNIFINNALYQNAGTTSSFQLAAILGHLSEYLHFAEDQNKLNEIETVTVEIALSTNFFEEIAKTRSIRTLTQIICQQFNINPTIQIVATASNYYRSKLDVYNNLLRDTFAGMSAIIGGCNQLYLPNYDGNLEEANSFGDRMSRNIQLILKDEAHLNIIADISKGSFYIEKLTTQLSEAALTTFQNIEAKGGWIVGIDTGIVISYIEQQAAALIAEYKKGNKLLIGVNKYPNPNDKNTTIELSDTDNSRIKMINLTEAIA
jgi:methylmalonyl-CoA mutase